jgi:hypothetical protein
MLCQVSSGWARLCQGGLGYFSLGEVIPVLDRLVQVLSGCIRLGKVMIGKVRIGQVTPG